MLETIQEYAVERLEATGTAADYRSRHEAHYLELAERGAAALGAAEQLDWWIASVARTTTSAR
jgi:hypothetical protein